MTPKGHEDISSHSTRARAWAPASLSNLGPGFDCLGVAIEPWGDSVEARHNDSDKVRINYHPNSAWQGTTVWEQNTAGVAAKRVLAQLDPSAGVDLTICKGVVPGSGIGSSAASAAAAAWAVNLLFGETLSKKDLVSAVLAGEMVASGSMHGDNVLPSLFGGIIISSSTDPEIFKRVKLAEVPFLAVCLPGMEVLTKDARDRLPTKVSLEDAISNASTLALMVAALMEGDWKTVGRQMMNDRIVEPVRAELLSAYADIRKSAMHLGAYGCALSGSGPTMFALAESEPAAERILEGMIAAADSFNISVTGKISGIDETGARRFEE
ncbi:MAG: homoserine kinase [Rhodothermia bacterium]|nr:MAG: homoserine kinase [Rhodothermia bacterium]